MRRSTLLLAALMPIAAACASKPMTLSAPAPDREAALDCALREATARGFTPESGGIADGYIRLARSLDRSGGDIAKETTARVMTMGLMGADRITREHLTITAAGGTLKVDMVGVNEGGDDAKPSGQGQEDLRSIVANCGGEVR